jgi:hypothetical protein
MSISITYVAHREQPITSIEQTTIKNAVDRYAIEELIAERERTGEGFNWSSFCVYDPDDPSEPGVIFEGATQLPDNSEDAVWAGLQHWCLLLSEIRRQLPGSSWHVQVDDRDIVWDEARATYDPLQ